MFGRRLLSAITVWCLLGSIEARARNEIKWNSTFYPNPIVHERRCGRLGLGSGWVCDPGRLLGGVEAIRKLDSAVENVRNTTECDCPDHDQCHHGFSLALAVVNKLSISPGSSDSQLEEAAKNFSDELRAQWKFGQCDDDMLIFLAVHHRKIWFSLGSRTTRRLTRSGFARIYHRHFPENSTTTSSADQSTNPLLLDIDNLIGLIDEIGRALRSPSSASSNSNSSPYRPGISFMPVWAEVVVMLSVITSAAILTFFFFKYCGRRHLMEKKKRRSQSRSCRCCWGSSSMSRSVPSEQCEQSESEGSDESSEASDQLDIRENFNMTSSLKRKMSQDRRKMSRMLSYM